LKHLTAVYFVSVVQGTKIFNFPLVHLFRLQYIEPENGGKSKEENCDKDEFLWAASNMTVT
jgi:hypothetical protein